jgi:uncharacterized protein
MTLRLRDATSHDLDPILELNRMAGVSVAAIDRSALAGCFASAAYFRVAEIDGGLAAFLIGTDQAGCDGNAGFAWFQQRHPAFLYIDRIVVAEPFRGHGLGRVLYTDLISFAEVRVPVLGCQVSLEPRDQASLLFHASLGFQEVAQLAGPDGRRLGVMERALCSFGFVRDQYLRDGRDGLPTLPWLAGRSRQPDARPYLAGCA